MLPSLSKCFFLQSPQPSFCRSAPTPCTAGLCFGGVGTAVAAAAGAHRCCAGEGTAANPCSPFPSQDKDKVSLTKTPKLDRSDGGKEVKERTTKRKLPFTVGTNGDQKDSDTGMGFRLRGANRSALREGKALQSSDCMRPPKANVVHLHVCACVCYLSRRALLVWSF